MLIINPGAAVPERPPGYSTASITLDDGGCTEKSCAVWALINHPEWAKPSGIQATWKETTWQRVLLKGIVVRHWKSKVRGLAKGCKYTWALMVMLPLPRTDQYWQHLKAAQSCDGDGEKEGRESNRCKIFCCGSVTGIKYCCNDLWDTDTLKPCNKIVLFKCIVGILLLRESINLLM